jgi:hypothetical protein
MRDFHDLSSNVHNELRRLERRLGDRGTPAPAPAAPSRRSGGIAFALLARVALVVLAGLGMRRNRP